MKLRLIYVWASAAMLLLLVSCSSYHKSMSSYYDAVHSGDYAKASRSLGHNKLIQKNRNALLFNLEMGRLERLKGDFTKSNIYFNRADNLLQSNYKSIGDIAAGNLLNPMQETYRGEDFEKFMMHYYKALNYASLGQKEEAVVEARRITIAENAQSDKFKNKEARYARDAFALNLQGMIYEMNGDINNAFIAYRNAAEAYTAGGDSYYGVSMPAQLRADLVRTAGLMGFSADRSKFESLYNVSYREDSFAGGELILFLEDGYAPVKEEQNFFLTTGKNGVGSFIYTDAGGYASDFSFDYNSYGISESKLSDLRAYRIAMPQYRVITAPFEPALIETNGSSYSVQLAQNLNVVAVSVLKERFLSEMAKALARQITKKLVEKGTEAATEAVSKSTDKKEDKDANEAEKAAQKKKQEAKAEAAGEVAGFIMNLVNTASEKADTRNWQSLPAYVSYVRIPLQAGENNITINTHGRTVALTVNGGGGLQMKSLNLNPGS